MDKWLKIRISEEQMKDLEDHARDEYRNLSDYVRYLLVTQKAMRDHRRDKKASVWPKSGTTDSEI
jgi:hypothetical protein